MKWAINKIEEKLVNYQKQILVLEEKLKEDPYVLEDLELIKRKSFDH